MERFIETHTKKGYDILVIGGGITGAALAYEAASRGLKVALVEKSDFGGATSAATSKMIHGGFRYLTHFEIGLVRESLRERRILMNIAPNFVHPLPFIFTHYQGDKYPSWMIIAGMFFYDLLSFDKNRLWDKSKQMPWHKSISAKILTETEPEILTKKLKGGSIYYDALNFYPERLTLAFIKSAYAHGAQVSNYAKVKEFITEEKDGIKCISGAKIYDRIQSKEVVIKSRLTINCAGPWADIVLAKASGKKEEKQLRRSEGIHIITTKKVQKNVITTTTPGGRHCFFVPWRNHTLIGTTDKEYIGNPDNYHVTKTAIQELLDEINPVFGRSEKITLDDVTFAYGGLRPLVEDDTKESYESSRKYEITIHKENGLKGLITVEGGKYTTSRNLARKVTDRIFGELKQPAVKSLSAKEYLEGCEIKNFQIFISKKQEDYPETDKNQIEFLARMYGTDIDKVLNIGSETNNLSSLTDSEKETAVQVIYAIRKEMAKTLEDILFRRTGLGTLGHPGKEKLKFIADVAASEAGWDEARIEKEIEQVEKRYLIPE